MDRLILNDASVTVRRENSAALGAGFRCGCADQEGIHIPNDQCCHQMASHVMCAVASRFLGLLHMEVFHQRLEQEHGAMVITTSPTVPYSIEHTDGSHEEIQNPAQVSAQIL